tara:strand:+ start:2348 stop:3229 length:882 start_codon:yes stop_codon:yes gene_type:complete
MKNLTSSEAHENITIVIVLFNSSEIVFKCLSKIKNFKIIIVDNGKNEKVISKIKHDFNTQQIIKSKKNLGFGKGVNSSIDYIKTKFFLILNPDCIIEETSIINLYEKITKYNSAAVGPWIVNDKTCYGIFPEKGKGIIRNSNEVEIANLIDNKKPDGDVCVDVHASAALLINKNNFIEIKMFNEKLFLFWEEIDLCKRFRNKKFSVLISPSATAFHDRGFSVKSNIKTFLIRKYYSEKSPLYYFQVKRNSLNFFWKILKYLFRSLSYLLILNFKKSLHNLIKSIANINYVLFG